MRVYFLCLAMCLGSSALADGFNGEWSGQGSFDDQDLQLPVDGKVTMSIQLDGTHLHLNECWQIDEKTNKKCMVSDYAIRGDGEIWNDTRKIGDAYPYNIQILESDAQVAEQMTFTFIGENTIQFQYTYMNMDGGNIHRKGILTLPK